MSEANPPSTGKQPRRVALTGGAGSGKSAVAERLRDKGITVIDSDRIAREVVAPGEPGLVAIIDRFGDAVLTADGELDRQKMRERMLADEGARRNLEAILHPLILERLEKRLDEAEGPYAVAEIPLLVESGRPDAFDRVVTVEAPMANRLERLMQRDDIDEAAARRLITAQASEAERRRVADRVIDNDGDLAELHRRVDRLHDELAAGQ